MAIKKLLVIGVLCLLVATQEWISHIEPTPLENNLQYQTQEAVSQPEPMEKDIQGSPKKDEVQKAEQTKAVEDAHPRPEQRQKQHHKEERGPENMPPPARNPFDRSGSSKQKRGPEHRKERRSEEQMLQQMQNPPSFQKKRHRGDHREAREFKRKPEHHDDFHENMSTLFIIGSTVIVTAFAFCCISKCRKHSKKSMDRLARRREMARFQQIQPSSQQQVSFQTQNLSPTLQSVDHQIRFHQIQLQKLRSASQHRNQALYEDHIIPVGQPVTQMAMLREQYRY